MQGWSKWSVDFINWEEGSLKVELLGIVLGCGFQARMICYVVGWPQQCVSNQWCNITYQWSTHIQGLVNYTAIIMQTRITSMTPTDWSNSPLAKFKREKQNIWTLQCKAINYKKNMYEKPYRGSHECTQNGNWHLVREIQCIEQEILCIYMYYIVHVHVL